MIKVRGKVRRSDIYEIISKNIRRYRIEANLTQEELAIRANYSHQFIRKIEAPKVQKTFSLETIYCISKALGREFSDMFIEYEDNAIGDILEEENKEEEEN